MMDKVSSKYVELLTVSVRQLYYINGICKKYQIDPILDFELIPTSECRELMKRLNLVFRSTDRNGGFIVLARVQDINGGGNNILRFPPQISDKLSFWMKLNNPNVLNFDDLSTNRDLTGFYYFTNQHTDFLAPRSNLHLTNASSGVSSTTDYIKKSGANYRFHHTSEVAAGTVKIKHILSSMEIMPNSIVNQMGQSDIVFNLTVLPLGKCQLSIGGSIKDEFYYVGSNTAFQVFGVIELLLSDTLGSNYRIVESDHSLTKTRPAYTILFQNRKIYWRYTIHLQPNSPLFLEMAALTVSDKADFLNRLNIITNDTAITFTRTSASNKDIVFVSDSELALQEKYISSSSTNHDPLCLTLKKYIGVIAKEADVRSDLPYPPTNLINATTTLVYSDIFLTL